MISTSPQSGFTLVETLVSITILLLVIIGPMTISSTASKSTSFSSDQVTAFFLAQEGLELVQKARDDFFLGYIAGDTSTPWSDFVDKETGIYRYCFLLSKCGLQVNNDSSIDVFACGSENCRLYLDESTGNTVRSRYTYSNTGTETPFTRKISFETIDAKEVKVTSEITWRSGNLRAEQSVRTETYLFNTYAN